MPLPSREELLQRVRKKQAEMSKGRKDPDEFRCPKAKPGETLEYQFYVLPGVEAGETIKGGGVVDEGMEIWYYENGFHYIGGQKYECPRIHGGQCNWCNTGFDLMRDSEDKEYKNRVSQMYLARSHFAMNVYFPNIKSNPEAVRGKIMWFNAPRTVWEKMDACINSDDPGDEERPRACGIFYHPTEGCYRFLLNAKQKGDFNTYEESAFIPNSFGPLAKDAEKNPDLDAINAILEQRHFVPSKFPAPDAAKLDELLATLEAKEQGKKEGNSDTEEVVEEEVVVKKTASVTKPTTNPSVVTKPAVPKLAAKPVVAKPVVPVKKAAPPPVEAAAEEEPVAETAEETPVETVEAPVEETEAVEEAVTEEAAAEPAEEEPPAKPAVKPAAAPVKPAAAAVKPAAAPAKPAAAAVKPVVKPAAAVVKPAAKPVAAAVPAEEDPELQDLLGAIKGKAK